MDQFDRATELEEVQRERAIAMAVGKSPATKKVHLHCEECGDEMNPARSALHYSTCIGCQEEIERGGR